MKKPEVKAIYFDVSMNADRTEISCMEEAWCRCGSKKFHLCTPSGSRGEWCRLFGHSEGLLFFPISKEDLRTKSQIRNGGKYGHDKVPETMWEQALEKARERYLWLFNQI